MSIVSNFIKKIRIRNKQRSINKKYEKEGLTDEILDAQIELNKMRNEHNIADEKPVIYEESVQ